MKNITLVILILIIVLLNGCIKKESDNIVSSNILSSSKQTYEAKKSEKGFDYEIINNSIKITKCWNYGLNIIIPEKLEDKYVSVIGSETFYQHTDTISIKLPKYLKRIEGSPFYRCYSIKEITIPASVDYIEGNSFYRCSSLLEINVEEENDDYSDIDGVLYNKNITKLIAYPEGKLDDFYEVPESVTQIGNDSFGYYPYALKRVRIPNSVTDFPDYNIFIYPDNITLEVASGSDAEKYAKKYNLKYVNY